MSSEKVEKNMKELNQFDRKCFELAVKKARKNLKQGYLPVGAVLVIGKKIIAVGNNKFNLYKNEQRSYVNHAENLLIIKNGHLLTDAYKQNKIISLYSTLEPCIQCLGASVTNHVNKIFFIQKDPNGGACNLKHNNIGLWYKEVWPEIIYCPISNEPKNLLIEYYYKEIKKENKKYPERMLRLFKIKKGN